MSSEKCLLHFPWWILIIIIFILSPISNAYKDTSSVDQCDIPAWGCGDRHFLCLDSVPDIAQREDSGGP